MYYCNMQARAARSDKSTVPFHLSYLFNNHLHFAYEVQIQYIKFIEIFLKHEYSIATIA